MSDRRHSEYQSRFPRRALLHAALAGAVCACASPRRFAAAAAAGPFICPPCGCAMDGREFAAPGVCPACNMTLIPKHPPFEPSELSQGAGMFVTAGGRGHEHKRIGVHYYLPSRFTPDSPILLVIPGAGRNGDSYRDAWIEAAESANVVVAALSYPEADYDFAAYQMGGVIRDLVIRNMPLGPDGQPPSSVHLRDEDISFALNIRPEEWLFNDFDRIFALLAAAARSRRTSYDLFGHSAGAQILHRSVLFRPRSQAERIVAANAGLYTQPDLDLPLPLGLKDTGVTEASLAASFGCRLTLLLGELDNDGEVGGTHLHTPMIDRYGVDRLSRGRTFFQAGREQAQTLGAPFNWALQIVPGVGHDFRAMTHAAALLLYG